ncbi:hypothetical protein ACFSL6_19925 [Paenibacillus thailandensis]|uniref:hypothetical protein n=1 Tax=Paenibacillus thailandensis TaxID=393250 RepID=UPI003630B6D7
MCSEAIVSFVRNVPFLVWASLLVVIFGVGAMPGLFALVLFGTCFLGRVYARIDRGGWTRRRPKRCKQQGPRTGS